MVCTLKTEGLSLRAESGAPHTGEEVTFAEPRCAHLVKASRGSRARRSSQRREDHGGIQEWQKSKARKGTLERMWVSVSLKNLVKITCAEEIIFLKGERKIQKAMVLCKVHYI